MAKRDEYPENKSLMARQQATIRGFHATWQFCRTINDFWADIDMKPELRTMLRARLDEATATAELASEAISGD